MRATSMSCWSFREGTARRALKWYVTLGPSRLTVAVSGAQGGGMQRVADKVFMLTPRNVEVSAEARARLLEKGFFNQY